MHRYSWTVHHRRERDAVAGQALTEYVLVISLVAIAVMGVVAAFGLGLMGYFSDIASAVAGAL